MLEAIAALAMCGAAISWSSPPSDPCTDADCKPVFYPGLNGSRCYRIPSVVQTHKGTLLAFAESRLDGCGDQGRHNIVVRRSLDGGETWGPLIIAVHGVVPCPGCPAAVSNPNPVEAVLADGSRVVLLAFDTMNNPTATEHGYDMLTWSSDDGHTWASNASTLTYAPEKNIGSLIGPAVGLQSASGTLFFWLTDGFLIFSRDGGATWRSSARSTIQHSECSFAFAHDTTNETARAPRAPPRPWVCRLCGPMPRGSEGAPRLPTARHELPLN